MKRRKFIHFKKSPLAGKTVRIKPEVRHHLYSGFGGKDIHIINWWDRTFSYSPYAMEWSVFSARRALCANLPNDNEVLLGTINGRRVIVHVTELELKE